MPIANLPLVTAPNQRGYANGISQTKDGLLSNCFLQLVDNPLTKEGRVYIEKRVGLTPFNLGGVLDSGNPGVAISDDGLVTAFSTSSSKIFWGETSCGTMTGAGTARSITKCRLGGVDHWMIVATGGTGWYLSFDALSGNSTFTADTTNLSATLLNVSSLTGLVVGQLVSGAGILAGSRIASISAPSTVVLDNPATATASTVTITREKVSKMLTHPASNMVGAFVELNGRLFVLTRTGRIYQSALNDPQSWSASGYLTANQRPGAGVSLFRYKNQICAIMSNSTQWFYDAGNPSGSVLSRTDQLYSDVGGFYVESGSTGDDAKVVASVKDKVFWQAGGTGSENGIYMVSGDFTPQKISTTTVDKAISDSPAFISAYSISGGTYVLVSSSVADFNWLFHVESGIWMTATFPYGTQISSYLSPGQSYIRAVCRDDTTGKLYYFDDASVSYQDNGVTFSTIIRTQRLDLADGIISSVEYYELDSDIQSSGTATLEVSDDDYQTWTTVGSFNLTVRNPRIYRGGAWRGGRAHRITHTTNAAFRASILRIKYNVGAT